MSSQDKELKCLCGKSPCEMHSQEQKECCEKCRSEGDTDFCLGEKCPCHVFPQVNKEQWADEFDERYNIDTVFGSDNFEDQEWIKTPHYNYAGVFKDIKAFIRKVRSEAYKLGESDGAISAAKICVEQTVPFAIKSVKDRQVKDLEKVKCDAGDVMYDTPVVMLNAALAIIHKEEPK